MTTIEVMRKALEALTFDGFCPEDATHRYYTTQAITALRAELERMKGVEPAYWALMDSMSQVPDLFRSEDMARVEARHRRDKYGRASLQVAPLYTAPIAPAIPALTPDDAFFLIGVAYGPYLDGLTEIPVSLLELAEKISHTNSDSAMALRCRELSERLKAERAGARIKE